MFSKLCELTLQSESAAIRKGNFFFEIIFVVIKSKKCLKKNQNGVILWVVLYVFFWTGR